MSEKRKVPYGLWPSPVTPASLAESLRLSEVGWDSDGETLVWLEGRSDRGVLVCAQAGQAPRDLTTALSVRARVGYGGGDFSVAGGYVYLSGDEGRLYRQPLAAGEARAITPQFGHVASPAPSPDGRWVVYVHTYEGTDGLAIVDADGKGWPGKLIYGEDFYMQPCWHPSGTHLAWVSWNHPNMPWDSTMLKMARLDTGGPGLPVVLEVVTLVDAPDVAVFQPQFSPDGRWLAYVSDETGWGNLYLYDLGAGTHRPLTQDNVEIATPAWSQGLRTYAWSPDSRSIHYLCNEAGFSRLWVYDLGASQARAVDSPLNDYTHLAQIAAAPQSGRLAFIASASTVSERIVSWGPGDAQAQVHRRSTGETVPAADLSTPSPVHWAAPDGSTVHGLYYPPASSQFTSAGLPPAIVNIHGGPTSQVKAGYNARAQFYATRGYAYLEVNYRGSTGYGKPYMAALRGQWGVLDVEDAVGGAQYLANAGLPRPSLCSGGPRPTSDGVVGVEGADAQRLVIMGGSAGGYTVLKALVDHPGTFKAGICLYGISNMFTLAADTHKFEERYLDSMLGPLPEAGAVYRERSPIFYADRIVDPIAVFQGEIDRVVPKAQSQEIVASLQRRGVPHEYHLYPGEGHGWRKRETIEAFYEAVERFLKQYVIYA